MDSFFVVLTSLAGFWLSWHFLKKNLGQIKEKNALIQSPYKRSLNYPFTLIWFGYLFVFFAGLIINNLIIR
jgi:hypothetical protein